MCKKDLSSVQQVLDCKMEETRNKKKAKQVDMRFMCTTDHASV